MLRYHDPVTARVGEPATAREPKGSTGPAGERRLTDLLETWFAGRWRVAEAGLYVLAAIAAWIVRFVQDDAFITYRYARNLARGEGLVFNPGEKVEGYTNFLWTVMHWVPERFGWSSPVFSQVIGIAMMVATVAVTFRLARRIFGTERMAFLVALTLLANMTFLAYATGGLETMQQTLLVVSVAALLLPVTGPDRPNETGRRVAAGLCGGLAVLTRMDSAVLVTVLVLAYLVARWRREADRSDRSTRLVVAALQAGLPALVLLVPWLAWKLSYYGDLLPNTFYAKSAGNPIVPPLYGLLYLSVFFFSYAAFLLIPRFLRHRRELFAVPGLTQVLVVVPVWCAYICYVGGDFMEFRFMVPIIPVLALVAAFLIDRFDRTVTHVALIAVLLVVSATHRVMPTVIPYPVLTFTELSHWPNESTTTWKGRGEFLAEQFPGGPDVEGQPTIAVTPLGVLPYFADLTTVDMLGLTDPVTARTGYTIEPYYPGHVRMARVEHLVDRDVNLVLAWVESVDREPGRTAYRLSELTSLYPSADLRELPDDARVIEVPQVDDTVWLIISLAQNDRVDEAIERNGWATFPIERTCEPDDLRVVEGSGPLADLANGLSRLVAERTCPS